MRLARSNASFKRYQLYPIEKSLTDGRAKQPFAAAACAPKMVVLAAWQRPKTPSLG